MDNKIQIQLKNQLHKYNIEIGNSLLDDSGVWAKKYLSGFTKKIALISNQKVFGFYGEKVVLSLEKGGFEVFVWLMEDGEEYKNFTSLKNLLSFLSENRLRRTDGVIALGGGVVGDLAGFASSIYLRGVPFLQMPTTFLSMIDSSVGGKTAVNTEFGKNIIGTFYQPNGVLIDSKTLKTLQNREVIAGFYEAIKHGAISNEKLFNQTAQFLQTYPLNSFKAHFANNNFISELETLLFNQISFKSEVVIEDEKEDTKRDDIRSRKILNFGHTVAHALEKITDYKYFKHGEAVGYGMLVAGEISKRLDLSDKNSLNLLNDVVSSVGDLPNTRNIDVEKTFKAFIFDKKSIGESLQWVLLKGIGKPTIISNENIPETIIKESLIKILKK